VGTGKAFGSSGPRLISRIDWHLCLNPVGTGKAFGREVAMNDMNPIYSRLNPVGTGKAFGRFSPDKLVLFAVAVSIPWGPGKPLAASRSESSESC